MSSVRVTTGILFGGTDLAPFSGISSTLEARIDKVMNKGAKEVRAIAKDEIAGNAYDTGRLYRSIRVKRHAIMSYDVGTSVYYAGFVHYGTHQMDERPFFEWAMDDHGDATINEIKAALRFG